MKLTKLQRHSAYMIMKAEMENPQRIYLGFCALIKTVFDIQLCLPNDRNWIPFRKTFPELIKKSTTPVRDEAMLFCSWEERKKAIQECINETA